MLIANLRATNRFLKQHMDARRPMQRWLEIAENGEWQSILDARRSLPSTDAIDNGLTCFNIAGNQYRLIAAVSYQRQEIVVVELMTHAEYSRKYVR